MEEYKEQIGHIREMRKLMENSSRFLSLSGISGILCGCYALAAAAISYYILYVRPYNVITFTSPMGRFGDDYLDNTIRILDVDVLLLGIAFVTLALSLTTAWYFSHKKAKKTGQVLWNPASRNLFVHLLLPLAIGGLFGLICMYKGWFGLVGPITLIFYGVALISAAKFTFGEVLYLGILQACLGLVSLLFIGYGLIFWALGFGLLHIVYGIVLHFKYDRAVVQE